jgi:hypothetical protein
MSKQSHGEYKSLKGQFFRGSLRGQLRSHEGQGKGIDRIADFMAANRNEDIVLH